MVFYVGKTFTATTIGARLKTARCEKCNVEFYYEMRRLTTGTGHAAYMIGQDSAKSSAVDSAKANLEKALATAEDPVPCPACFWINQSAVRKYRRAHHRGWYWLAGLALAFGALIFILFFYDARDTLNHPPSLWVKEIWITIFIAGTIIAGSLLIQTLLRRRFDPNNQLINGFPKLAPGTPPPIVKNAAGDFHVTPNIIAHLSQQNDWAIFRPGQLIFQGFCCECLDTNVVPYRLPIPARPALAVPICLPCLKKIRKRFWSLNLAMLPLWLLSGWLIGQMPKDINLGARLIVAGFFGFFLGAICLVIVDTYLRPYRMGYADKANSVGKIRFRNPACTAILIRQIAESEGKQQRPPEK